MKTVKTRCETVVRLLLVALAVLVGAAAGERVEAAAEEYLLVRSIGKAPTACDHVIWWDAEHPTPNDPPWRDNLNSINDATWITNFGGPQVGTDLEGKILNRYVYPAGGVVPGTYLVTDSFGHPIFAGAGAPSGANPLFLDQGNPLYDPTIGMPIESEWEGYTDQTTLFVVHITENQTGRLMVRDKCPGGWSLATAFSPYRSADKPIFTKAPISPGDYWSQEDDTGWGSDADEVRAYQVLYGYDLSGNQISETYFHWIDLTWNAPADPLATPTYQIRKYHDFDDGYYEAADPTLSDSVDAGGTITLSAASYGGYVNTGWRNGTGDVPTSGHASSVTVKNIQANANVVWTYEKARYTIHYSIPGQSRADETGTWSSDSHSVTFTAPTLTGYRCTGWSGGTGSVASTGSASTVDVTLNAHTEFTWTYAALNAYQTVIRRPPNVTDDPSALTSNLGLPAALHGLTSFSPAEGITYLAPSAPTPSVAFQAPALATDGQEFYLLRGYYWTENGALPTPVNFTALTFDDPVTVSTLYTETKTARGGSRLEWLYQKMRELKVGFDVGTSGVVPADVAAKITVAGVEKTLVFDGDTAAATATVYYPVNASVTLTTALEPSLGIRCTGVAVLLGAGVAAQPVDDGDRKSLPFSLTDNTSLRWVYRAATGYSLGAPITPPVALGAGWTPTGKVKNLVKGHADDTEDNILWWNAAAGKLYPVRPTPYFEVQWDATNTGRYYSQWGSVDQTFLANAPVRLQPDGSAYTFQTLAYSESEPYWTGAFAGLTGTLFEPTTTGRSLLRFADAAGAVVFVTAQAADPGTLTPVAWEIGTEITDTDVGATRHADPEGRNGFVVNELSYYDGAGDHKAHDRPERQGPILPVNRYPRGDGDPADRELVVFWYNLGKPGTSVGWPVKPRAYDLDWPAAAATIVIAEGSGSGPLPAYQYTGEVYVQDDPELAGYNPNEEHALILGSALYAIRDDLNTWKNGNTWTGPFASDELATSQPYALLKYRNPTTDKWALRVFQVAATDSAHTFDYSARVGQLIVPPTPLDLLPLPVESYLADGVNWHHRDHKGGQWAKAANWTEGELPPLSPSTVEMRWYYPLQKGFYYPWEKSDGSVYGEGDPVAFRSGGGNCTEPGSGSGIDPLSVSDAGAADYGWRCTAEPALVSYVTAWPSAAPILRVGETLTDAKYGLPDVVHMASAEVLFDQSVFGGNGPLAKLFDPLSPRWVALSAVPDGVKIESSGGKLRFPDLPPGLQPRLLYDQLEKKLLFRGVQVDQGIGEVLLLPNVMTLAEKARIVALSPAWEAEVDALYNQTRNPEGVELSEVGGSVQNPYDETKTHTAAQWRDLWGSLLGLSAGGGVNEVAPLRLVGTPIGLTAGMAQAEGYLVVAENDDASLGAAPVALHVIRVAGGPYQGEIKAVASDNPFDEKLTLRHTGDFGGEPERVTFSWYYKPDQTGLPPHLPAGPQDTSGWVFLASGPGLSEVTIEGPGKLTLSDNWVMVHYYYGDQPGAEYGVTFPSLAHSPSVDPPSNDSYNWSTWAGAPGGETAQLAEGWIKRVVASLNPLDARVRDFRNNVTSTSVSMLTQLGQRYEGPIALSGSADNLNSVGLIEAYQTVLNRGKDFSIDAPVASDYGPANVALLNAATRLGDFYTLLGNEAYADALDPTIGFDTRTGGQGSMASSLFAFENQVSSLLEEELGLLRGRDDSATSTRAPPVYNRLTWNFTNSEGEVAYVQAYNLSDKNGSGVVDELDAKVMYPQGHGDAWGHYLTAMSTWYQLLRHPHYTWEPRVESVLVGGAPLPVDYLDERKFAQTAAYKARVGSEIVDLTYRKSYVDSPDAQWQGYRDDDEERAWGVDEWARRAGQGALFDWAAANAMLPSIDSEHTGLQKIDRTTVTELYTIASEFAGIQTKADQADAGLNPLGLAKGVVPFDIDPAAMAKGQTHFEQIYTRAAGALQNARTVFDYADAHTKDLRANQDSLTGFERDVASQERAYLNQLIELFGYPYAEDIGPGRTYPLGYQGPDWAHFMYVDLPEVVDADGNTLGEIVSYDVSFKFADQSLDRNLGITEGTQTVEFQFSADGSTWVAKPESWTTRRAPGEIQNALGEVLKADADYRRALKEYDISLGDINTAKENLEATYGVRLSQIQITNELDERLRSLEDETSDMRRASAAMHAILDFVDKLAGAMGDAFPQVIGFSNDVFSGPRSIVKVLAVTLTEAALVAASSALDAVVADREIEMVQAPRHAELKLAEQDIRLEIKGLVTELGDSVDAAMVKQQELFVLKEAMMQAAGRYKMALDRGLRVMDEREQFRKNVAGDVQDYRYQDLAFRTFRNDAVQKYRASFDLAARYAYLAAAAYDYDTNLLQSDTGAGARFLTDIVRQRAPGDMVSGAPMVGRAGLADPLARLSQNFGVYKTQLGLNNPQTEANRFSLRSELFRIRPEPASDDAWRAELARYRVDDLWAVPAFERFCRPFASSDQGAQPALVIPLSTEVTSGRNFFGWPLGTADSAYDASQFSTKIGAVGVWFDGYAEANLAQTPRAYLVPVGSDVLRSPTGDGFTTRKWKVVDQRVPVPYPITVDEVSGSTWLPSLDSLNDEFGAIRQHSMVRAYPSVRGETGPKDVSAELTTDTRLVGRSVWNTQWVLIIPGATLLGDAEAGLDAFVENVSDIRLYFKTYAYSGN